MLSSSTRSDDDSADHSLIVAHLFKPFKHSELHSAVRQALLPETAAGTSDTEAGQQQLGAGLPATQALRVLVAEDSLVNVALMRGLLENHDLTIVNDGQAAIDAVNQQPFDVVLMDVRMPGMDGLEATRQIRKQYPDLPIVAMTAQAMPEDRDLCFEAGMNDYLTKPLDPIQLEHLLENIAATTSNAAHSGAETRSSPSDDLGEGAAPSDKPMPPDAASHPPLDWEAALRQANGKESLLREFSDMFHAEAPRLLKQAEEAIAQNEPDQLRLAAHTLKGSLRYFGPTQAESTAASLEKSAIAKQLDGTSKILQELDCQVQHVLNCLLDYFNTKAES